MRWIRAAAFFALAWGAGCGACEETSPRFDPGRVGESTTGAAEAPVGEAETEAEAEGTDESDEPGSVTEIPMAELVDIGYVDAPSARMAHVAVYTGDQLVVWGGDDAWPSEADGYAEVTPHPLATGGRYTLATERWAPTRTRGAPAARYDAEAVYTGSEMIVWGGRTGEDAPVATGGRYDPARDRWRPIASAGAPAGRYGHTLIWTGSEAIVWGGFAADGSPLASGARYDPAANTWRSVSASGAPAARGDHGAVWTGNEMIVWGGRGASDELADGARYDPSTDTWRSMSAEGAPSARRAPAVGWSGSEMIAWGGYTGSWDTHDRTLLATGGVYDPAADRWRPTSMDGAFTRDGAHGVWTGTKMAVFGETNMDETNMYPGPALGLYDPHADAWTLRGAPEVFGCPLVLGHGELLVWGGSDGTNLMAEGVRIRLP